MSVEELMKSISENVRGSASVSTVFGEARTVGSKTVIPIASVRLGFGAGSCECKSGEEEGAPSAGGGGGGGAIARPVAVLEVTEQETRVIPVVDVTRIALASLCAAGCITWLITRMLGRRKKG